jgi:3-keto-5-aminohexanoate cleavage enzyme
LSRRGNRRKIRSLSEWAGTRASGLEDNIYFRRGELAPNERFVERMVKLATEFGRGVATPEDARRIMHLKTH